MLQSEYTLHLTKEHYCNRGVRWPGGHGRALHDFELRGSGFDPHLVVSFSETL